MMTIGLIKEEKVPKDVRVALTPQQCVEIQNKYAVKIVVETSADRCYSNDEYKNEGIELVNDLSNCDIILGIKEVPIDKLIEGKTYLFFSHTKKKQPYNQKLMHALIKKKIRMIDYEALTHNDGQRILGFGFFFPFSSMFFCLLSLLLHMCILIYLVFFSHDLAKALGDLVEFSLRFS